MSTVDIVGQATVAVLRNPDAYLDRPAFFARQTISCNETLAILNEIDGPGEWKASRVSLSGFFEHAKELWSADTESSIQDRLHTQAYVMLGTYGLFEESNRYDADFSNKVEDGFDMSLDEFKARLRDAVAVARDA